MPPRRGEQEYIPPYHTQGCTIRGIHHPTIPSRVHPVHPPIALLTLQQCRTTPSAALTRAVVKQTVTVAGVTDAGVTDAGVSVRVSERFRPVLRPFPFHCWARLGGVFSALFLTFLTLSAQSGLLRALKLALSPTVKRVNNGENCRKPN